MTPGRRPVAMPRRWVRVRQGYAAPGVHGSGMAPRLEHRAVTFTGALDDWHAQVSSTDVSRADYELEDEECFDISGHETVHRRFGHRVSSVAVLSDQWLWVVNGTAHQLLGTVAAEEYEDYCDIFESVAETFDPGSRPSRSA
jgi:hypothetical protein